MVRVIFKYFLLLVLSLLLLMGLGFATFPWWGFATLERGTGKVLREFGFSQSEVVWEELGRSQLRLRLERLRYQGATVADAGLMLSYNFKGLRNSELEQVKLTNPEIEVDLSHDWPMAGDKLEPEEPAMPRQLPARFPVNEVNLDDALLSLRGADWARTLELDARLAGREAIEGEVSLQGEGIHVDARTDVDWPDLSGRATVSAKVDELGEWVEFARLRGWIGLPQGLGLSTEPFKIKAETGFAKQTLQDWNVELLSQGVIASMAPSKVSVGQLAFKAKGDGSEVGHLNLEVSDGGAGYGDLNLSFERLSLSVHGILPDSLAAVVGVKDGRITWSDGSGRLTGLEGEFALASLQPLASKGRQVLQFASIEQGEFASGAGQLRLSYASERAEKPPLELEITTTALGGKIRILVDGRVRAPLALSIQVFLDSVQLQKISALFPQFGGQIEGEASGKLALRLEGTQFVLLPGGIQLVAGTNGRFEYLRQGWLTQDPKLDPAAFVSERDILEIMQDPQGAQVLTELALRDLKMSSFSLKIEESASGDQSVVAKIKGKRSIKGVTVPVVLDVPIRGDVKETINAVFEFKARM